MKQGDEEGTPPVVNHWQLVPVLGWWATLSVLRAWRPVCWPPPSFQPRGWGAGRHQLVSYQHSLCSPSPDPMVWVIPKYSCGPFPLYPSRLCFLLGGQAKAESHLG